MKQLFFFYTLYLISQPLFSQESLLETGQKYLKLGRNDLALETLLLAEKNLPDPDNLQAAQCYNDLGIIYYNNGNLETAYNYLEKGLLIRKDKLEKEDPLLADSYLNIGLLFLQSDFLKAIIYLDKALKIYQDKFGANHPKVAFCYSNIAFTHRFHGNYQDALAFLNLTLDIWEELDEGNHPNKALTLSNKGRVYEELGNYDQALSLQTEALKQYLAIYGEKHPEVANTYTLIGSIQLKKGKFKDAVESFQKSIYANLYDQQYTDLYELPEMTGYFNADYLLSSLWYKGQALERLHFELTLKPRDVKKALLTYQKCDELITKIRQSRLSETDKIRLSKIAFDVYDNGIRIALYLESKTFKKDFYREIAFTFCERSKASTLLEAINETKAQSFAGIPDRLLSMEDSLKSEISWLEKEIAKGGDQSAKLRQQLFDYQKAYRQYIADLEKNYPNYFKLKYEQKVVSIGENLATIPNQTAVLSYFIGSDATYVFYLARNDFRVYSFSGNEKLLQLANGMRNGIKYRVKNAYEESAIELYNQLIPEIKKGIKRLIIIPDGILGTLPFEAFIAKDKDSYRLLIEDYAVSYDHAVSLYFEKAKQGQSSRDISGIFLSAPVHFDQNELKMATLPGSEEEVKQIQQLFLSGKDKPTVCLQEKASEATVKSPELSDYRYLHFATHGIVNQSKPELSRIFLSPDQQEDGSLYSGEIYNLSLNADLITLSACETGLGKVEKGEGIIGLSRSLTYAGAKNLIVSLWQVADESTAKLMISFYSQHLYHSQNPSFADDLRKAKLEFIHGDKYKDPYFWAPFVLIGQ